MEKIKVGIVDDHKMVSKALEDMICSNPKFQVVLNCSNGDEVVEKLSTTKEFPSVVLMDVNMPFRNGIETTMYLAENYPNVKIIALTMEDSETTIIRMMRAGAKGYLLKDMSPDILFEALETVHKKGSFYTDFLTQNLLKIKNEENEYKRIISEIKPKELEFIKLACTEMTYKEIADMMMLIPKTIDNYRESVFAKLDVKSRIGLVLFAIKNNLTK